MDARQTEQFVALWTAAQSSITAFIRTLIPNVHEADDVMQRVAMVLVRKFDEYDTTRPFVPWAIGIAKFEVLYYRRNRATDRHVFSEEVVYNIASRYESHCDEVDPVRVALEFCIGELRGKSKQVIDLRYRENTKSPTIARKMGMSAGSVRMMLCRVRNALRLCVESRIARTTDNPATG